MAKSCLHARVFGQPASIAAARTRHQLACVSGIKPLNRTSGEGLAAAMAGPPCLGVAVNFHCNDTGRPISALDSTLDQPTAVWLHLPATVPAPCICNKLAIRLACRKVTPSGAVAVACPVVGPHACALVRMGVGMEGMVTRSSLEGGLWKPSALKAKTCGRGSSEQRQTRSATSSGGSCLLRSPANPLRALTTCLGYIGRFRCQPSYRARCSRGSGADHGHATGGRPAHGAQAEPISIPGAARRRPDGNVCGGWAQRCTVCCRRAATAGTGNPQEIVGM